MQIAKTIAHTPNFQKWSIWLKVRRVFDEEVKTDVDAELDPPFARARLTYQQVIPFDPDIHPDRIRFGEVTDILGKVNIRKACGPDHITNKIIRYLLPILHIIIQDLTNICVFHGYHPRAWKRAWALMIHKPSKRRSDPCSYRPISLLCCLSKVRSHHDQAVNELGREH